MEPDHVGTHDVVIRHMHGSARGGLWLQISKVGSDEGQTITLTEEAAQKFVADLAARLALPIPRPCN